MRHTSVHFADQQFWTEVLQSIAGNSEAEIAVGVASLLANEVFHAEVPPLLEASCVGRLPDGIRLWAECYGSRALLADSPGTKLHLLLREQLHAGDERWKQEKRTALLPRRRAPRILPVNAGAGLSQRVRSECAAKSINSATTFTDSTFMLSKASLT